MNEIRRLRKKAGLSQFKLAVKAGVTETTVRNWERRGWIGNIYLDDSGRDSPASLNSTGDM